MLGRVSLLFSSLHTVYNGFQHTQCSPAYWLQTARWTNLYSERKSVCLFLFLPDLGINLRKFQQVSACMNCFFLFHWPVSCLFKFVFKVVSASFNTDWVRREVDLLVLRFVVNTLNMRHRSASCLTTAVWLQGYTMAHLTWFRRCVDGAAGVTWN